MDLVNLDGLTLIGPGSEWFWAMLQMVLLTATILVVYRQLRAQAATNAVQQLEALSGRWHSGLFTQCEVELAVHLSTPGAGSALGPATVMHAEPILELFEDVARLHGSGYVHVSDISDLRVLFLNWWPLLTPAVEYVRDVFGPAAYSQAEAMVGVMARLDEELGTKTRMETAAWLEAVIRIGTTRLRRERDFRTGVIPSLTPGEPSVAAT